MSAASAWPDRSYSANWAWSPAPTGWRSMVAMSVLERGAGLVLQVIKGT